MTNRSRRLAVALRAGRPSAKRRPPREQTNPNKRPAGPERREHGHQNGAAAVAPEPPALRPRGESTNRGRGHERRRGRGVARRARQEAEQGPGSVRPEARVRAIYQRRLGERERQRDSTQRRTARNELSTIREIAA